MCTSLVEALRGQPPPGTVGLPAEEEPPKAKDPWAGIKGFGM